MTQPDPDRATPCGHAPQRLVATDEHGPRIQRYRCDRCWHEWMVIADEFRPPVSGGGWR